MASAVLGEAGASSAAPAALRGQTVLTPGQVGIGGGWAGAAAAAACASSAAKRSSRTTLEPPPAASRASGGASGRSRRTPAAAAAAAAAVPLGPPPSPGALSPSPSAGRAEADGSHSGSDGSPAASDALGAGAGGEVPGGANLVLSGGAPPRGSGEDAEDPPSGAGAPLGAPQPHTDEGDEGEGGRLLAPHHSESSDAGRDGTALHHGSGSMASVQLAGEPGPSFSRGNQEVSAGAVVLQEGE